MLGFEEVIGGSMSPSAVTTFHNNKIILDLRSSNPNPNPQAYREPPPPPFGLFFYFSIGVCGKMLNYPAHMVHALIQLKLFFLTKVYIKMHCCCVIFLCCIAFLPHTQICQSNYGLILEINY